MTISDLAREGGAAFIVTTDADGQYSPLEIESLLAPVVAGRADFVTGSRRLGSEETWTRSAGPACGSSPCSSAR